MRTTAEPLFRIPGERRRPAPATPAATGARQAVGSTPEFISVPEWARRVGCSRDSAYRAARRDEVPGLFTIGRLRRVNWAAFLSATDPDSFRSAAAEQDARRR